MAPEPVTEEEGSCAMRGIQHAGNREIGNPSIGDVSRLMTQAKEIDY